MRPIIVGACLSLLALSLGCNEFNKGKIEAPPPPGMGKKPTAAELVTYLNRNGELVTSIEVKEAFLRVKQEGENPIDPTGYLACQKGARPGDKPNFRMMAYVVGNTEVDVGSNNEEFWYWVKRAPQPWVFHCAYADYEKVAKRGGLPFPFQPEWVVEALGMAEYDAKAAYEVRESKATYDLIQRTRSVSGGEVLKVIAFHKTPRAGRSQVAAYILWEPTGDAKNPYREICSAVIEDSQAVAVGGGRTTVLPTRVRLNCPREKVELTMDLTKEQVNVKFDPARVNVLFTRQTLRNLKSYDLARGAFDSPADVRQAGSWNP